MVTRFTKVGGGVTAHSHVRLQFRYLGNRSALTLKSHQKQTYLFQARSFIAKHGVLLVRATATTQRPPSSAGSEFLSCKLKFLRGVSEFSRAE